MKTIGIIAEYNPFHKGHAYQLLKAREEYGADAVLIILSGDFTQRGAPAVLDKYKRTELALRYGADLVIMMPAIFSCASAEYFANAGVAAIEKTGVCDSLLFGCENDDIDIFIKTAKILNEEPPLYKETLKSGLKEGLSFPLSREKAVRAVISDLPGERITEFFLSSPNNILGLEYIRALLRNDSKIKPIAMKRVGADFHDASLPNDCGSFASASAIRNVLSMNGPEDAITRLKAYLPDDILSSLKDALTCNEIIERDDASLLLHEALLKNSEFSDFSDCSTELSNRINNVKNDFFKWSVLNDLLKTRELTYSRISRVLLHILLGIKEKDIQTGKELGYIPYLRILGFTDKGAALLSEIKKNSALSIITKPKDAKSLLDPMAYSVFLKDIYAADIYRAILTNKSGRIYPNEYSRKLITVRSSFNDGTA